MLNAANLSLHERCKLYKDTYATALLLDELVLIIKNGQRKTRFEHWNGKIPKFAYHLRTWGEAGVVTVRDIKTSKLMDKGITCMFIGYDLDHAGDCYKMYNPLTGKYHISRDIKWLN